MRLSADISLPDFLNSQLSILLFALEIQYKSGYYFLACFWSDVTQHFSLPEGCRRTKLALILFLCIFFENLPAAPACCAFFFLQFQPIICPYLYGQLMLFVNSRAAASNYFHYQSINHPAPPTPSKPNLHRLVNFHLYVITWEPLVHFVYLLIIWPSIAFSV